MLEEAIANLKYGAVQVNTDTKLSIAFPSLVWGGCPGSTIYELNSGIGFVCLLNKISLSLCLSFYVPPLLTLCLCLSVFLSICLCLSVCLYLSIYLSISIYLPTYLSVPTFSIYLLSFPVFLSCFICPSLSPPHCRHLRYSLKSLLLFISTA